MLAQPAIETLGKVHFETSCTPAAAAASIGRCCYQHSFWYRASQTIFEEALKADPECAIAYWGIALSLLWNPHAAPPAKNLADGAAAIAKGKRSAPRPQRERDYLDALRRMYADYDKVDHRTRVLAYLKAMEQLAAKYPNDDEAQIYYALALNVAASPTDKTYANQLKGAAILETIFKRQPRSSRRGALSHPPLRHAGAGREGPRAARRYAKMRPLRRTPCTCRRTSSRASATGRNRSSPISRRRARPRRTRSAPISCTPWTTRSMPICSSGRTRRRRR